MNALSRFRKTSIAAGLLALSFLAAVPTVADAQWGRRNDDYRRNDNCNPRNDNGYYDRRNRPSERWVRERGYENGFQLGQRQAWQDFRNGQRANHRNWVFENGMQGFRQEWIHDGNYRTGFRNGYRDGYYQAYQRAGDRRGGGGWGRY
jgi:hypothetical protein